MILLIIKVKKKLHVADKLSRLKVRHQGFEKQCYLKIYCIFFLILIFDFAPSPVFYRHFFNLVKYFYAFVLKLKVIFEARDG